MDLLMRAGRACMDLSCVRCKRNGERVWICHVCELFHAVCHVCFVCASYSYALRIRMHLVFVCASYSYALRMGFVKWIVTCASYLLRMQLVVAVGCLSPLCFVCASYALVCHAMSCESLDP